MDDRSLDSSASSSAGVSSQLGWPRAALQIAHVLALSATSLLLARWHLVDPLVALGAVTSAVASTAVEPSLLRALLPKGTEK